METFIGHIAIFGFNFAPTGWALCNGALLSIAQNTALFSLLGTTYGGNGQSTFALPDLQGRVPMGQGQGPGLPAATIGEKSGTGTNTILVTQMPAHTHVATVQVRVSSSNPSTEEAAGAVLSNTPNNFYAAPNTANGDLGGVITTIQPTGSGQPVNNYQPYLVVNFCIALQGIFPSRN